MKIQILKLIMLFAIVYVFSFCDSKSTLDDGIIDPNSQVIEKEIDSITFKFCLLNEQGKPATVFNEGENIIFSFSLKNNLKENISILTQFINDDFYRVYKNNNTDMGKAWTGTWCNFRNEKMTIELLPDEQKELNCPWRLSEIFQADYPLCKGDDMNPLPIGEYFTSLHFVIKEKRKAIKVNNHKRQYYFN